MISAPMRCITELGVLHERLKKIEMLVLDVDGVLTDGRITYTDAGAEIKAFHVRDGSALKFWHRAGKKSGIVTGRSSAIVDRRAKELGISKVVQGVDEKLPAFQAMIAELGLDASLVCYVGDDLPDVPVLRACGLGVTVADGCAEAKQFAAYVTQASGGGGAVREVIEWILRAQGAWPFMEMGHGRGTSF